jgi:hypothetical protein
MLATVLGAIWSLVSLPFRLLFWAVEMLGRAAALALGFVMMVVGVALGAGPLFMVGIPVFVVGLLITLKSLD